jgi:hypothetical protein
MHHRHHGFKESRLTHHTDGSVTIHHMHHEGPEKDIHHAVANLDGVHDSMEDHLGQPNPGEAEANAGQSGVPGMPSAPAPAMGA